MKEKKIKLFFPVCDLSSFKTCLPKMSFFFKLHPPPFDTIFHINKSCFKNSDNSFVGQKLKSELCSLKMWHKIQWKRWGKWIIQWSGIVGVAWWLSENVLSIVRVEGTSMWPTLNPEVQTRPWGDILLVWRWHYQPCVGDVVCAYSPHLPHRQIVKRIIGLGPAIVLPYTRSSLSSATPLSSNEESESSPKIVGSPHYPPSTPVSSGFILNEQQLESDLVVHVPAGYVWLEGDHHWESFDSNDYGPIPIGLITGKVTRILLPHAHFWTRFLQPIPTSLPPGHSQVRQQQQQQPSFVPSQIQ